MLGLVAIHCGSQSELLMDGKFQLSIDPPKIVLTQGSAPIAVSVHVDWLTAPSGPITISIADLPPGIKATTAVIPAGVVDADIELTATDSAAQGDDGTVNVDGRADAGDSSSCVRW